MPDDLQKVAHELAELLVHGDSKIEWMYRMTWVDEICDETVYDLTADILGFLATRVQTLPPTPKKG